MKITVIYCLILVIVLSVFCDAGLLKGRKNDHDDSLETLLAVGLIAKALTDIESPPETPECPAPIQVTKIIPVPVVKEKIVYVRDKKCDGKYQLWQESKIKPQIASPDSAEAQIWKNEYKIK